MSVRKSTNILIIFGAAFLTGCSQINKVFDNEDTVGYQKAGSVASLEVPPDLTAPQYDSTFTINSSSDSSISANRVNSGGIAAGGRVEVLPESSAVKLQGVGSVRWLEVNAPAGVLWKKVQGFWSTIGADLKRNEPTIGIMETDWIESRGHLPQGTIQKVLSGILKNATDSGIRDRYTVRFEKKSADTTRIFITHRGAEMVVTDLGTKWEMRPRRPSAEAEMLNRLKAYLQGVDPKTVAGTTLPSAPPSGTATLSAGADGTPVIRVQDSYDRTWVRTGSALTQAGFTIEGQDSGKGLYAALWQGDGEKKKGFFRRLVSPSEKFLANGSQYIIQVSKAGSASVLAVKDKNGKAVKVSTARKILERLKTELNR